MTFLEMYGEALDTELSSVQVTGVFTLVRRKAKVNDGVREFVRLTECVKKTGDISLVDETPTYDVEATLTDFWKLAERDSLVIVCTDGVTTWRLVEGRDFVRKDKRRLDVESPGWRDLEPGNPAVVYLDDEGGQTLLGLVPAPDIPSGETWTLKVPYVPHVGDMVDTTDVPFTFSSNAALRLRPWHQAPVHYAASKLELGRKDRTAAAEQLKMFSAYVADYLEQQRLPGGDTVMYGPEATARPTSRAGIFAGDPLRDW